MLTSLHIAFPQERRCLFAKDAFAMLAPFPSVLELKVTGAMHSKMVVPLLAPFVYLQSLDLEERCVRDNYMSGKQYRPRHFLRPSSTTLRWSLLPISPIFM